MNTVAAFAILEDDYVSAKIFYIGTFTEEKFARIGFGVWTTQHDGYYRLQLIPLGLNSINFKSCDILQYQSDRNRISA